MSKVKTDAIETRAGGTSVLTIGTATQTIKLPGGTPGADKVLKSDASGNATWGTDVGGALVYLASSRSTVNAATVDFQEFKSTDYLFYLITGFMEPVSDNVQINMRLMDGASAITTSNYLYRSAGSSYDGYDSASSESNDNWTLAPNVDNTQPVMFSFQLHLQDATDDDYDGATLIGNLGFVKHSGTAGAERTIYGLYPVDNANIDGVRFYHSSGDVNYHKIALYGMKGS